MTNGAVATPRSGRQRGANGKLRQDSIRRVQVTKLHVSPENNELYRPVDPGDQDVVALADSIRKHGVRESLVVTRDGWILSGHRRLAAAKLAGLKTIPCRFAAVSRLDRHGAVNPRFITLLREYNRQRVKSFDEKLREEAVTADPEVVYQALIEHRQNQSSLNSTGFDLRGVKHRAKITKVKRPFLEAIQTIIKERQKFWPLNDRQIHYSLLNDPPLIHASKPGSTYSNDIKSYKALVELLTRARVAGIIPMHVIQDATRPVTLWDVHRDEQAFIRRELEGFCKNYWRDLMQSQPNHIEIVGEKNTIEPIIRPIAAQYTIPMTIGRGFCSLRPRHDIAERFEKSGKDRLVLLILSDFDPDGEEIAHSLARSLRDDFGIKRIEPVKVALTADQVDEYELPPAMQAKQTSTNYKRFADKHGDDAWELETLPPETLQSVLQEAIDSVLDVEVFNHEVDQEKADAAKLEGVRRVMLEILGKWRGEE